MKNLIIEESINGVTTATFNPFTEEGVYSVGRLLIESDENKRILIGKSFSTHQLGQTIAQSISRVQATLTIKDNFVSLHSGNSEAAATPLQDEKGQIIRRGTEYVMQPGGSVWLFSNGGYRVKLKWVLPTLTPNENQETLQGETLLEQLLDGMVKLLEQGKQRDLAIDELRVSVQNNQDVILSAKGELGSLQQLQQLRESVDRSLTRQVKFIRYGLYSLAGIVALLTLVIVSNPERKQDLEDQLVKGVGIILTLGIGVMATQIKDYSPIAPSSGDSVRDRKSSSGD